MSIDTETETPSEQFEDIDWNEIHQSGFRTVSRRYVYLFLTLAVLLAAFLYDYFLVPKREPTVPPLDWHVTQVDWMFIATLVILFYTVVVPLYSNPRMTRYYWKEMRKNRAAVLSFWFLAAVFVIGIVGPLFMDPPTVHITKKFQPPMFFSVEKYYPIECVGTVANGRCYGSMAYPLGTTRRGKDIVKIVVYGMQISMKIGLISALIVATIATTIGTMAAYIGGVVDEVLMRYVDIQLVFPAFLLYLLLIYLFGGSLFMFIIIFGFFGWGGIARLVRSEALQRREDGYITAASSAGASSSYVIRRHIVPNVSNTVITATSLLIPGFILAEASLAFIGLGAPTIPSWGQAIAQGRSVLTFAWWCSTIPGIFLFLTILAFNFLGDALRDALDPRTEGQS